VMPLFVANAVPVLVDADLHTGNVDPVDLERRITARTRAIVVTHLWGNPVDMISMMEIARRHNLKVVEDCSHAHGATCDGKMVGSFGDVGIFSLQGKKLVAAGQGGILVTNDRNAFERAVLLGHFNVRSFQDVHDPVYRRYAETGLGLNYRMHPLAAAIANRQMDRLEGYIAGRRHNLEYLSKGLVEIPGIQPPVSRPHVTRQVYYSYKPTFCSEQLGDLPIDLFVEAVAAEGVPIERYRMTPLHTQPIFTDEQPPLRTHGVPEDFARTSERRRYRPGDLPNSEDYASRLLSMSVYTEPADHVINEIIAAFEKVVEHLDELHDLAASRAIPSTGSPQGRRPPLA
jgi:perosamine synthetase